MRKHRTREQWHMLVAQQRDSGLSAPQFCKHNDIAYASFCNWRKRLSVDVEPVKNVEPADPGFVDLTALLTGASEGRPSWNIVLSLGNGVELRLSQNG